MKFRIHAPIWRAYRATRPVGSLDHAIRIQKELERGIEDSVEREEMDWTVLKAVPQFIGSEITARFDWEVTEHWFCDVEVKDDVEAQRLADGLMQHFREHGSLPDWFERGKLDSEHFKVSAVHCPLVEVLSAMGA